MPHVATGRCLCRDLARVRDGSRRAGLDDHHRRVAPLIRDWLSSATSTIGAARARPRARGDDPNKLLPAVHRVVSLAKRWLLGTHQGAADSTHMSHYLNEFVFRFNRRRSRSRGMVFYRVLELAVAHEPMRFQDLIASRRPRKLPPEPGTPRGKPAVAVGGRTLMGVATHSG